jgi:hypothetical protein
MVTDEQEAALEEATKTSGARTFILISIGWIAAGLLLTLLPQVGPESVWTGCLVAAVFLGRAQGRSEMRRRVLGW